MTDPSRIPPHDLDAERAVLGAVLLEGREALPRVIEALKSSDFYTEAHRIVYETMLRLFDRGEPVDLITLGEELRRVGELEAAGGAPALGLLAEHGSVATHLSAYMDIVRRKAALRELIHTCEETIAQAYTAQDDATALVEQANSRLLELRTTKGRGIVTPSEYAVELAAMPVIEAVRTGIPLLDKYEVVMPDYCTIIAARPGLGKTALGVQVLRYLAIVSGRKTLFVSVELTRQRLGVRLLSLLSNIPQEKIRTQACEPGALDAALKEIATSGVHVQDEEVRSVRQVVAAIRRAILQHGIELVIVDHVHLIEGSQPEEQSEQAQVAEVSKALYAVAKDTGVAIIALAQLNRAVETRAEPRPMLRDLRNSGVLEQNAASVVFIWDPARDEIEGPDEDGRPVTPGKRRLRITVAKNRDGVCNVEQEYLFEGAKGRFEEKSDREEPEEPRRGGSWGWTCSCGAANRASDRVCEYCGAPRHGASDAAAPPKAGE